MNVVRVRVPGSTSNCGAGFDTLGLAVQLYNTVTVGPAAGPGRAVRPVAAGDERAVGMVQEAAALFFRATVRPAAPFSFHVEGEVPPARGLGSSVTVLAGVLAGLDALHGTRLSRHELVRLATELEGHPDNASAGILGGFTVSRCDPSTGAYLDSIRFEVPASLALVIAVPEHELLTKESRAVLPPTLPFFDAVKSINAAAYLTAAFATGDFGRLRHARGDFLHEPYRLPRIPGAAEAIGAGVRAGALTGWLSGSGSSVVCVAERAVAGETGAAMTAAYAAAGVPASARTLAADNEGLRVE